MKTTEEIIRHISTEIGRLNKLFDAAQARYLAEPGESWIEVMRTSVARINTLADMYAYITGESSSHS